jgi:hypothetical protein
MFAETFPGYSTNRLLTYNQEFAGSANSTWASWSFPERPTAKSEPSSGCIRTAQGSDHVQRNVSGGMVCQRKSNAAGLSSSMTVGFPNFSPRVPEIRHQFFHSPGLRFHLLKKADFSIRATGTGFSVKSSHRYCATEMWSRSPQTEPKIAVIQSRVLAPVSSVGQGFPCVPPNGILQH